MASGTGRTRGTGGTPIRTTLRSAGHCLTRPLTGAGPMTGVRPTALWGIQGGSVSPRFRSGRAQGLFVLGRPPTCRLGRRLCRRPLLCDDSQSR